MNTELSTRTRRVLFYALLGVCLAVWAGVIVRLVDSFSQAHDVPALVLPEAEEAAELAAAPQRPGPAATYQGDFEDPFALPAALLAAPVAAPRPAAETPAPPPPPLALVGIVGDTALLSAEGGASYIVRAGDPVGEAQVVRVEAGRVVLRHAGHAFTLTLPN